MCQINQEVVDRALELRDFVRRLAEKEPAFQAKLEKAQDMLPQVLSGMLGQFRAFPEMTRLMITGKDGLREYYTRLDKNGVTCNCPDFRYPRKGKAPRLGEAAEMPLPCKHCITLYAATLQINAALKQAKGYTEAPAPVQTTTAPKGKIGGKPA